MKYVGSKNRHAAEIIEVILSSGKQYRLWIEPFVGGANVIDKLNGHRIGADNNKYLIALLKAVQAGWKPPEKVTEEEYHFIRLAPSRYEPHLVGFVAICCSFGGKWWGGYARGYDNEGNPRNYAAEQRDNLIKQSDYLRGVSFICSDYRDLIIPSDALVYCDPPYAATVKYATDFDHTIFWNWVRSLPNDVYVSEYTAPDDFKCVWEKEVKSLTGAGINKGGKLRVERLWVRK